MVGMSFASAQDTFFADFFRHYTINATEAGNHDHDDRWPDLTDAGRAERLAWLADARAALEATDGLSREEDLDRRVLLGTIDELRFDEEELDELSWSPITYSYMLGAGLFGLLSREFAPVEVRLAAAAGRMEGIPAALDAARANLTSGRGRAVSGFHTEKAIATMPGVADLCRTAIEMAAEVDEAVGRRVTDAAGPAIEAVDAFVAWLRVDLQPTATGDFRLGRDLYERKFDHSLKATITPAELRERAWADYHAVRAEMLRLAQETWPVWLPGEPLPEVDEGDRDAEAAIVRRVLDAIASEHQEPGGLIALLPGGDGPHRGLLSRPRRHQPADRAPQHRLDAAVPARPCPRFP